MKKILIIAMTLSCTMQLHLAAAQSAELQQLALNIEKLAQFRQILSDMKKGYDVFNKGYSTIQGISQGTFNLHDNFLNNLLLVSPALRNYSRIGSIISNQGHILSEYKTVFSKVKAGNRFSAAEISYMGSVHKQLLDESLRSLDELTLVLTDNQLRMSDDERMEQIDRIDRDMSNTLTALRGFNRKATSLDAQRAVLQRSQQNMGKIIGQPDK